MTRTRVSFPANVSGQSHLPGWSADSVAAQSAARIPGTSFRTARVLRRSRPRTPEPGRRQQPFHHVDRLVSTRPGAGPRPTGGHAHVPRTRAACIRSRSEHAQLRARTAGSEPLRVSGVAATGEQPVDYAVVHRMVRHHETRRDPYAFGANCARVNISRRTHWAREPAPVLPDPGECGRGNPRTTTIRAAHTRVALRAR